MEESCIFSLVFPTISINNLHEDYSPMERGMEIVGNTNEKIQEHFLVWKCMVIFANKNTRI